MTLLSVAGLPASVYVVFALTSMVRVKPFAAVIVMTLPFTEVTVPPSLTITMSIRAAVIGAPVDSLTLTLSPVARSEALTALLPSKNLVAGMIARATETELDCWTVSDVALSAVTMPVKLLGARMVTLLATRDV